MRSIIFFCLSIILLGSCSDKTSNESDIVIVLVKKWPTTWGEEYTKKLDEHSALKNLKENGVFFTQAFTGSPEASLAEKTLRSGMHTGHLLSDNFDKNNLSNFKNSLLSKNYEIEEHSNLTAWSDMDKKNSNTHIIKLTSNSLAELNTQIAKLLESISNNSLLVVTALSGSGVAFSESSLRVPLIFYTKDDKVKKGVSNQAIYTADLFPTIADFLGIPYSAKDLDGQSFYKNIKRPSTPSKDRILFWKSSDKEGSKILRYNQWKMVQKNPNTAWQLFDMITDPKETDNVSAYHPGKFEKFKELINKNQ